MSLSTKLPNPFDDYRGSIQPLFHNHSGSIVIITSKSGVQRANHYHKEDYHYCYVVSGTIEYFERPACSLILPKKYIIKTGEMFYTGPNIEHCMYFPEDTTFLTVGGRTREQKDYENDLVRISSLYDIYEGKCIS